MKESVWQEAVKNAARFGLEATGVERSAPRSKVRGDKVIVVRDEVIAVRCAACKGSLGTREVGHLRKVRKPWPCDHCRLPEAIRRGKRKGFIVTGTTVDKFGNKTFEGECENGHALGARTWHALQNLKKKPMCPECTSQEMDRFAAARGRRITGTLTKPKIGKLYITEYIDCGHPAGTNTPSELRKPLTSTPHTCEICRRSKVINVWLPQIDRTFVEWVPGRSGILKVTYRCANGHTQTSRVGDLRKQVQHLENGARPYQCFECTKLELIQCAEERGLLFVRWDTAGPQTRIVVMTPRCGHVLPSSRLEHFRNATRPHSCWCASPTNRSHHLAERFTTLLAATELAAADLALLRKVVE